MTMDDRQLFFAALSRAPNHGESREVADLRRFVHTEMLAGRIDGSTTDRLGQLVDALSAKQRTKVNDLIGYNNTEIPWDVLEVRDDEGTVWRRAFGDDRYSREDDGSITDMQEYDWITDGGLCTTDGLLFYKPLQVTKVAQRPTEVKS